MRKEVIKLVLVGGALFAITTMAQAQVIGGKPRAGTSTAGAGKTAADQEVMQNTNVNAAASNDRRITEKDNPQVQTQASDSPTVKSGAKKTSKKQKSSAKKESEEQSATTDSKKKDSDSSDSKKKSSEDSEH